MSPAADSRSEWSAARGQQHRLKRVAILRVASVQFEERGYAGTSLADIAIELGISNNALYHYFKNKEELAYCCVMRAQDSIEAHIDAGDSDGSTGIEKVEAFMDSLLSSSTEGSPLPLRLTYALTKAHNSEVRARDEGHRSSVVEFVRIGLRDGTIRQCDPVLLADFILAGTYSMYRRQQNRAGDIDTRAVVSAILLGVKIAPC